MWYENLITQLVLENFQSHKYSTFNFDKGLNVLVGVSNSGKTSIARALSLVLYNTWDKSWVRNGSLFAQVTLMMESGITVVRKKGDKVNEYTLTVPGQAPQTFTNFGVEVPGVISKALKIEKINLDKDDSLLLNLSSQLEPLFLFNRSGSQKAKVFGKLSGAHFLDHALRSLATEKKQTNTEKSLKTQELEALKIQCEALNKIKQFEPVILDLNAKNSKLEEGALRIAALKSLFSKAQEWKRRYTQEIRRESILAKAPALEIDSISASVQRLQELKQLKTRSDAILTHENALISAKNQFENDFEVTSLNYVSVLRDNKTCPTCFEALDDQKIVEIEKTLLGEHKCLV